MRGALSPPPTTAVLAIESATFGAPAYGACWQCGRGCSSLSQCPYSYDVTAAARAACDGSYFCDFASHASLFALDPCAGSAKLWQLTYSCTTPPSPPPPPPPPSLPPSPLAPPPAVPPLGENSSCVEQQVVAEGVSLQVIKGSRTVTVWLPRLLAVPGEPVAQSFQRAMCVGTSASRLEVRACAGHTRHTPHATTATRWTHTSVDETPCSLQLRSSLHLHPGGSLATPRVAQVRPSVLQMSAADFVTSLEQPALSCGEPSAVGRCSASQQAGAASILFSSRPLGATQIATPAPVGAACSRWGGAIISALDAYPAAPPSYCDSFLSTAEDISTEVVCRTRPVPPTDASQAMLSRTLYRFRLGSSVGAPVIRASLVSRPAHTQIVRWLGCAI